jgi:hypothetical protein
MRRISKKFFKIFSSAGMARAASTTREISISIIVNLLYRGGFDSAIRDDLEISVAREALRGILDEEKIFEGCTDTGIIFRFVHGLPDRLWMHFSSVEGFVWNVTIPKRPLSDSFWRKPSPRRASVIHRSGQDRDCRGN